MVKPEDVDHECRNTIVKLRGQFLRIQKVVKEIEKDLEELDKRLERLECAIKPEDPYP